MSTMGQNFTKAEHDAGWPESLKHGQLAALQYPYVKGEPAKIRLARDRAGDILSACKSGELPHTATTVTVTPPPLPIQRRNEFASSEWLNEFGRSNEFGRFGSLGVRNGRITSQPPPQPHDVTTYTVTAPAFAAWLAAQPETPSAHIAAWFEAVGANTQDQAAPAPVPVPTITPPPPATARQNTRRNLLTPTIETAQRDESDRFDTPAIWAKLQDMAEKKIKPLLGKTDEGIQWLDENDEPQYLTLKMLRDRLGRQKKATQKSAKTPLVRVK